MYSETEDYDDFALKMQGRRAVHAETFGLNFTPFAYEYYVEVTDYIHHVLSIITRA